MTLYCSNFKQKSGRCFSRSQLVSGCAIKRHALYFPVCAKLICIDTAAPEGYDFAEFFDVDCVCS